MCDKRGYVDCEHCSVLRHLTLLGRRYVKIATLDWMEEYGVENEFMGL